MSKFIYSQYICKNQKGASAVIVSITILTLIALGFFSVDLGYIISERNRLQNAVDAGALAGARTLYTDDGLAINPSANIVAEKAAQENWEGDNYTVERGHWSFGMGESLNKGFYPNESTTPVSLWDVSTTEIDQNINHINAVRVSATLAAPISSFFSRIWGYDGFTLSTSAVGYIGFTGSLEPYEADQIIAICSYAIVKDGDKYTCSIGRMLTDNSDTAGWTNLEQPENCTGGASSSDLKELLKNCPTSGANKNPLFFGEAMEAINGVTDVVLQDFINCWMNGLNNGVSIDKDKDGIPDEPWHLVLPVIACPGKNNKVENCSTLVGAVQVNIVWILRNEKDDSPYKMGDWSSTDTNDANRWNSFVAHFNLQNSLGIPATKQKKTIYFVPDCTAHAPTGNTGEQNYGILAKIPVLVN